MKYKKKIYIIYFVMLWSRDLITLSHHVMLLIIIL